MRYRICEKETCGVVYSTGKDYDDFIGEPLAAILRGVDISKLEKKGLCPFCNPTTVYNQPRRFYEVREKLDGVDGERKTTRYPLFLENGDIYIRYYSEKVLLKDFINPLLTEALSKLE